MDALSESVSGPRVAGAAVRLPAQRFDVARARARRSARGAGARAAAHGQQCRADRPQPHRHVVHGAHLHQGARRGRRGAVAGDGRRAGARRRGHGGADPRRAVLTARGATGAPRQAVWTALWAMACAAPLFIAGRRRAPPDPRALRLRSRTSSPRRGLLVPACRAAPAWARRCGPCSASSTASAARASRCSSPSSPR